MTDSRYSRQILFPGIGEEGQQKLSGSQVALVGCGALGTVIAEMLTRSGLGSLTIIDRDFVEFSNLQRQTLFEEADARAALPKAIAARNRLQRINSEVEIRAEATDLVPSNIEGLLSDCDLVMDASDNFEARYLVNDWAFKHGVPWIYGACVASYGVAFAFQPGVTACLQCLFPEPPAPGSLDTCDTAGIIAPIVHTVTGFQVAQALKLLTGQPVRPRLLHCDIWEGSFRCQDMAAGINSECACCGQRQFRFLDGRSGDRSVRLCGRDAVQISPAKDQRVDFSEIESRLAQSARVMSNPYLLRIEVDGYEISLFPDGRSIIRGTDDPARARSIYARYVGR